VSAGVFVYGTTAGLIPQATESPAPAGEPLR
jgi:hypothetical protein